jgi:hypothetical protein
MRELLEQHLRENAELEQLFEYFTTYQWEMAPEDSEKLEQRIGELNSGIKTRYAYLQRVFCDVPVYDILQLALIEEHSHEGLCMELILDLLFATHFGSILHGDLRVMADHLEWDWFDERIHELELTLNASLTFEKQVLISKLQAMRDIALEKHNERVLATMMGFHTRLGSDSSLSDVEPSIMSDYVFNEDI